MIKAQQQVGDNRVFLRDVLIGVGKKGRTISASAVSDSAGHKDRRRNILGSTYMISAHGAGHASGVKYADGIYMTACQSCVLIQPDVCTHLLSIFECG